jgi:hypothetical protein
MGGTYRVDFVHGLGCFREKSRGKGREVIYGTNLAFPQTLVSGPSSKKFIPGFQRNATNIAAPTHPSLHQEQFVLTTASETLPKVGRYIEECWHVLRQVNRG